MIILMGSDASSRVIWSSTGTSINRNTPANASGKITSCSFYFKVNSADTKFGTFYGSGTSWTCRAFTAIGAVAAGSKQTFSGLNVSVSVGDLAGYYISAGNLYYDNSGGSGKMNCAGDQTETGVQTYIVWEAAGTDIPSIEASGVTPVVGGLVVKMAGGLLLCLQ